MMKIKELIELLKKQDQELNVVVNGYEDGFDYVTTFEIIKIKNNVNTEWYYGSHAEVFEDQPFDEIVLRLR